MAGNRRNITAIFNNNALCPNQPRVIAVSSYLAAANGDFALRSKNSVGFICRGGSNNRCAAADFNIAQMCI